MSSPALAHKPYNHHNHAFYNQSLPPSPSSPVSLSPNGDRRKCYSDETNNRSSRTHDMSKKTRQASKPLFQSPSLGASNKVDQEILSKEEYQQRYLESFEIYYKRMDRLFPGISKEEHLQNYKDYCKRCYKQYLNKMTTCNDPGTVSLTGI